MPNILEIEEDIGYINLRERGSNTLGIVGNEVVGAIGIGESIAKWLLKHCDKDVISVLREKLDERS